MYLNKSTCFAQEAIHGMVPAYSRARLVYWHGKIEGDREMGELSQRTIAKVSGPAWESLRGQFLQVSRCLLASSPDAESELFTTYVKFTVGSSPNSRVFAAIWLKSSKRLIVGLAVPEDFEAEELGPAPLGTVYKGLTKYFVVERGGAVPKGVGKWAVLAYKSASSDHSEGVTAAGEGTPIVLKAARPLEGRREPEYTVSFRRAASG
jgi:hypothetical protein